MLGNVALGQLALGQLPITPLNISARAEIRTRTAASPGLPISGRVTTLSRTAGISGLSLAGNLTVRSAVLVPLSAGLFGRTTVKVSAPADGGLLRHGSGKKHHHTPWLVEPDYEEKRAKPFQPIWDRRRQKENEEAARKAAEPPPLPPQDIFSVPGKITIRLDYLPDYSKLVPGDWKDAGPAAKEAMDASDAEMVLREVVEAEVKDAADAVSAIQQLADEIMRQALEQAAQARQQPASRSLQIGIPARPGAASYDEQMHDVSDHADAMAALRESGLIPEEV